MENVSGFYSHCDLALGLPVFSRPAVVANPCPTIDFIGLPLEATAEDWQAQSQVTMAIKPGHILHLLQLFCDTVEVG